MSGFKLSGIIEGAQRIPETFRKLEDALLKAQAIAVQKSTLKIHEIAVKSVQDNASGAPSIRYNPKRNVLVSKPGSPPNTDTGRLAQSIQFEFEDGGLRGFVGTNLKYGAFLEFGTTKMLARPWLSPAVTYASEYVGDFFREAIKDGIFEVSK